MEIRLYSTEQVGEVEKRLDLTLELPNDHVLAKDLPLLVQDLAAVLQGARIINTSPTPLSPELKKAFEEHFNKLQTKVVLNPELNVKPLVDWEKLREKIGLTHELLIRPYSLNTTFKDNLFWKCDHCESYSKLCCGCTHNEQLVHTLRHLASSFHDKLLEVDQCLKQPG